MSATTTARTVASVEYGEVTVYTGPTQDASQRPARRNTYSDGSQAVIYVSTARRVAPSVAATFYPEVELTDAVTLAQPSQLNPVEQEQHLAQLDALHAAEDEVLAAAGPMLDALATEQEGELSAESVERLRRMGAPLPTGPLTLTAHAAPLDTTLAEAVNEALRHAPTAVPAAPVKHRLAWFDHIDGAKVPHTPERKRRMSDVVSVQCSCGEASPTATRKEIDGWVAEHKSPAR
jgi:hypothetical protein